ncbi:PDR/VanB family oxidoreductase [Myxosarcina sp. GI1]|uniref:PDR/VanB family oxidoreductase n=1 Tax=Myxosarcina sp. GI1 TaxID=1541065 RepID=UPI00056C551F|nr:PDR/VanB family oxidoreductase [Myxosarcina sp. GI1]
MNEQTVRVVEIKQLTPRIKSLRLVSANENQLAAFSPGSHVAVAIPVEQKTKRNSYSLCSSPYKTDVYEIAVLLTENSRGGSEYLHQISVGTELKLGMPKNSFALASLARKHLLIAGGIGITPFLSILATLNRLQIPFELHYAAESPTECAFYEFLQERYSSQIKFYFSHLNNRLDPKQILKEQPLGTHVYLCTPPSLSEDILNTAQSLGYPDAAIHRELFGAVKSNKTKPFTAVLAQSETEIKVPKDKTLLEALEAANIPANYSCRAGGCGACEVKVLAGEIKHLDSYYSPEERAEQDRILACISRAKSKQLVIDI